VLVAKTEYVPAVVMDPKEIADPVPDIADPMSVDPDRSC